jgi:hypothetical protein
MLARRQLSAVVAVLLPALALSACAGNPPRELLRADLANDLGERQTLHVVRARPAALEIWTPGIALIGGGGLAVKWGAAWTKDYGLADPAIALAPRLGAGFAEYTGITVTNVDGVVDDPDDLTALRRITSSGHMLIVRTRDWRLHQDGTAFSTRAKFKYMIDVRLVRVDDGAIVWRQRCGRTGTNETPIERWEQDNAALLKSNIARAVDYCAEEIVHYLGFKP